MAGSDYGVVVVGQRRLVNGCAVDGGWWCVVVVIQGLGCTTRVSGLDDFSRGT